MDVLREIRSVIDALHVDWAASRLGFELEGEDVIISGEVRDVATKKRILRRVAAIPAVAGIVDRLHTVPAERMSDAEIRDHVSRALLAEPILMECALMSRNGEERVDRAQSPASKGRVELSVSDGIVTLDGDVPSLTHRRLAGVLAWWVPGSRDVVDALGVVPPEEDNADEMLDAIRLVLEKDPFVDASKVSAVVEGGTVTLRGLVPSEPERDMAEQDVFYVLGVDEVRNEIEVQA